MTPEDRLRSYLEGTPLDAATPPGAERLRTLLRSPAVWAPLPPATLADTLLVIATERIDTAATAGSVRHQRRLTEPHRLRRLLTVAAAVVLFVAGGVVGTVVDTESAPRGTAVILAGTELAPGATATARVRSTPSGTAISLDVRGLPPARPGSYYEAWLKSVDDDLAPVGTFHLRGGTETIELWAGVDTSRYRTLTVTIQYEHRPNTSTGLVVLRGRLPSPR